MSTVLLSCNGYRVIREVQYDSDLPALCAEAEAAANDGYCVVASTDGRLVADAEGYWPDYGRLSAYERAEASMGESS